MRRTTGPDLVDVSSLIVARRSKPSSERAAAQRLVWRDRMGHGSWSAMDTGYLLALFVIGTLNLLDITITLIYTGAHGWVVEGNPLIRSLAESGGEFAAVGFKLALVAVALTVMWVLFRRTRHALAIARSRAHHVQAKRVQGVIATGTLMVLMFYVWVVQHNVRIVFG